MRTVESEEARGDEVCLLPGIVLSFSFFGKVSMSMSDLVRIMLQHKFTTRTVVLMDSYCISGALWKQGCTAVAR